MGGNSGNGSGENQMTKRDWKQWSKNTLIFSAPTLIALLVSLQSFITNESFFPNRAQIIFVVGSAYQAFLASAIDWIIKFKADSSNG